jgi:hypothetical protein
LIAFGQQKSTLLWKNEPDLVEIAHTQTIQRLVSKGNPQPVGLNGSDGNPNLSNPKMKISLWGPPDQLTLSISKNDVWDRRRGFDNEVTLQQLKDSYMSEANKNVIFPGWNVYTSYLTKDKMGYPLKKIL